MGLSQSSTYSTLYIKDNTGKVSPAHDVLGNVFNNYQHILYGNASLYNALLSASINQGIKDMNVFYDTLFLNLKTYDSMSFTSVEYILIDKLLFNYDTNTIDSDKSNIISFGNTANISPDSSNGNCFIDNILLPDKKIVLICGLSSFATPSLTANINGTIIQGNSYIPVVYEYNLNSSNLNKLYPDTSSGQWNALVLGNFVTKQNPIVTFNKNTNNLNFIFKTTLSAFGSSPINSINDITFEYSNGLTLTNVRQLTSLSANNNFTDFVISKGASFDGGEKIIMSHKNNSVQMFNLL